MLALAPPGAAAAGVVGHLAFPSGATVEGDATLGSPVGAMDLSRAAGAGFSISFAEARGYVVTRTVEYVGQGDVKQARSAGTPQNESVVLTGGTLSNFTCAEGCALLLFADGPSSLSLSGRAHGPLEAVGRALAFASGGTEAPAPDSFLYKVPPGWLAASGAALDDDGVPTLRLAEGVPRASGALGLFLKDATAEWRSGERVERVGAPRTAEPTSLVPGVPTGERVSVRFMVLKLADARLDAPAGLDATFFAPAPTLDVAGALRAERARGVLLVEGERFELRDERLDVEGSLKAPLAPEPAPVGALDGDGVALRTSLSGDATGVAIAGRALPLARAPSAASATAVVITGLSLAGLLALALHLKPTLLAPLYMRLTQGSLLRNDNRRRIYDAVRARPGATVAELVRDTGLSEIVVRHHVRMLEAHRRITVRGTGKVRGHFALDGGTDPTDMPAHVTLKDATRRRIADVLAASPRALTQGELAEAAGVSRRLVSHHLGRLEDAGLAEAHGGTPRLYVPTPRLLALRGAREPARTARGAAPET